MAHQCERPTCAEPATVAYGFDPARGVAWLEPFVAIDPRHGRLCRRHADAMVVPQGWWLEDRRAAEHLFAAPSTEERAARRPWRSRRPTAEVISLPLVASAEDPTAGTARVEADGDETVAAVLSSVPAWSPTFAADDDLGGVLNATSPLLGRAFARVRGTGTRARPPAQGA